MVFFLSLSLLFFLIQWFGAPPCIGSSFNTFHRTISYILYIFNTRFGLNRSIWNLFNHKLVSRAKILGNAEIFVKSGSDINLTCVAVHSPTPPSFIYWYKEGRVINYSQRGGISVLTERKTRTSKLVISKAMSSDSGNYTCIPSSSGKFDFILLVTSFFISFRLSFIL